MGVTNFAQEITCPVAPGRIFRALIVESSDLIPRLLPQFVRSVDLIQGDGGAGSIEQINFTEASNLKYVKHRIDELDKENFVCKYTVIEGDQLGDKLESIEYEIKFEAAGNGGSVCKLTSKYKAKAEHRVEEEEIKAKEEKAMGVFKVVETYLLENPNAYA